MPFLDFIIKHSPLWYLYQSIWRDEAYSLLVSERPVGFFLTKLTFEPPFYYVLLHYWIKIFGSNDIAARVLSLLGFTLAVIVVIEWSAQIFKKHWLAWYLPLLFVLNPLLLYYAFEIRAYGWMMFFVVSSHYTFLHKKWRWFTLATILGFYTHSYFIFVPVAQAAYYFWQHRKSLKPSSVIGFFTKDPFTKSGIVSALAVAPWIYLIFLASSKLKDSWYFPVDFQLFKSVLGNLFLGYEGTPWFFWKYTFFLSLIILGTCVVAFKNKTHKTYVQYFLIQIFLPLITVLSISTVKPLFVNRYFLPITIAEIFVLIFALYTIKNKLLQKSLATLVVLVLIWFNSWFPQYHSKSDIRTTIKTIDAIRTPNDRIYARTPLVLYETLYYASDRSLVSLYNPNGYGFPWYVGDVVYTDELIASQLPLYPKRAFVVNEDGTFTIEYESAPLPAQKL